MLMGKHPSLRNGQKNIAFSLDEFEVDSFLLCSFAGDFFNAIYYEINFLLFSKVIKLRSCHESTICIALCGKLAAATTAEKSFVNCSEMFEAVN